MALIPEFLQVLAPAAPLLPLPEFSPGGNGLGAQGLCPGPIAWAGKWLPLDSGQAPGMGSGPGGSLHSAVPTFPRSHWPGQHLGAPGVPSLTQCVPVAPEPCSSRPDTPLCSQGHRTDGTAWWLPWPGSLPRPGGWASLAVDSRLLPGPHWPPSGSVPSFLFSGPALWAQRPPHDPIFT